LRWNAIIDAGSTPPRLRPHSRNPQALKDEIEAIATENGCEADVWWDRFNWFVYVTLTEGEQANAKAALAELEPLKVRKELNTDEKGSGEGYSA
jgi:hypothetical protein